MAQNQAKDWAVDRDQNTIDRVAMLGQHLSANQTDHEERHDRDGEKSRARHGVGLGEGERTEETPLMGLQREDRQEGNGNDEE